MTGISNILVQIAGNLPQSKWKPRFGRVAVALLSKCGASADVIVNGHVGERYLLDARGRTTCALVWNRVRDDFPDILTDLCKEFGESFYDIGANVGLVAVPVTFRLTPHKRRLIAFEPVPRNANRLQENLILNGLMGDSTIVRLALGDFPRSMPMYVENALGVGEGNASLSKAISESFSSEMLTVEVATLDSIVTNQGFPLPDVVKIDAEGADVSILRGARKVLEMSRPIILGEFGPQLMRTLGDSFLDVPDALPPDYRIFGFASRTTIEEFDAFEGLGDVLLVPEEKVSRLPLTVRGKRFSS